MLIRLSFLSLLTCLELMQNAQLLNVLPSKPSQYIHALSIMALKKKGSKNSKAHYHTICMIEKVAQLRAGEQGTQNLLLKGRTIQQHLSMGMQTGEQQHWPSCSLLGKTDVEQLSRCRQGRKHMVFSIVMILFQLGILSWIESEGSYLINIQWVSLHVIK